MSKLTLILLNVLFLYFKPENFRWKTFDGLFNTTV